MGNKKLSIEIPEEEALKAERIAKKHGIKLNAYVITCLIASTKIEEEKEKWIAGESKKVTSNETKGLQKLLKKQQKSKLRAYKNYKYIGLDKDNNIRFKSNNRKIIPIIEGMLIRGETPEEVADQYSFPKAAVLEAFKEYKLDQV